ncbi:MAG: ATP-binding protein [Caldilineaceae bacterium]|nr:ATP-binding protein [Caldilineaceae bacterium]
MPEELQYLTLELARLDLLLQREMRRWALAEQDPNDDYRGLYIPQSEAELLSRRPFNTSWGQWIELPDEEEEAFQGAIKQITRQIEEYRSGNFHDGEIPRLLRLDHAFNLNRTDMDILLLAVAPAFDTKYERIYGYLQDNVTKRQPTVRLALDLLGEAGVEKFNLAPHLEKGATLFHNHILKHVIEPPPAAANWLNQTLHPDETVIAWLRGGYEHHGLLGEHITLADVTVDDADHLLVDAALEEIHSDETAGPAVLAALYGTDSLRHDATARRIAQQLCLPLLTIDLSVCPADSISASDAISAGLRDARLTGAVAYFTSWDDILNDEKRISPAALQVVCAHPGPVIISSRQRWQPGGIPRQRAIRWIELNIPDTETRLALWQHYLENDATSTEQLDKERMTELTGQFHLSSGSIRDAVAAARDGAQERMTIDDLYAAARAYSNPRLSALANKIEPRFEWEDIILPANQATILHELVATVRKRPQVLYEWGVGRKLASSAGVTVLFSGPPGTGKTMAAQVIAHELGLDLYKIDLSSVVSKYIGETEKNLERIFTEAASSNAILFFDEADSLFGKRTETKDAHDRYANLEISYLLQRMEAYDGVTILATNLSGNLDEAFTRRLHFAVDFPFPRVDDRRRIWETLFPDQMPRDPALDFADLAQRYELAGGNIRNIIVSAAYLAADNGQVVTMEHLFHGAKRELQKMGRLADGIY